LVRVYLSIEVDRRLSLLAFSRHALKLSNARRAPHYYLLSAYGVCYIYASPRNTMVRTTKLIAADKEGEESKLKLAEHHRLHDFTTIAP
jgi:hypothetical protein